MTTTNVRSRRRRRIQADAAVLDDNGDGDDDDGRNQKQQQCPIRIDRLRYQYQQQLLQQQQQQQQQQEVVSSTASSDGNGEGNDEKGNVFPVDAAAAAAAAVNSNLTASDDSLLLEEEEEEEEEEATVFSNNSNSNNITVDDSNFNDDDKLLFAEEEEEEDFLPNDDDNTTAVTSSSSFTSSYSDADTDTDSSSTPAEADTAVPIWNSHQYDPLMMSDDYFGGGDFRRNRDRNRQRQRQRQRQRRIMDDEDDVASSTYTVPSFLDETIFTQQKSVTEENRHKEFQNTFAIKLGHGIVGLKRWGHTKNITMNGSSSDDYRMGLISIAIVVIVVVFIWLILLEIFRRLGPKRVGYILSGPKRKKGNDNAASSENDDDDHIMRAGATNVKEKEDENKNKNEDILNMKYLSENTPRWLFPKKANKNKINMRRVKSFFSTTTGNYHCSDDDNDNYSFSSSSSSDSSYSSSSSCSSRSRSRGSDDDDEESGVISQSGRMSARSTDILSTSSQNDVSTDTSHFYKVGVIRDGVLDVSQQHHQDDDHQDDENTSVVGKDKDWGKDSVSLSTVARPQQQQQQQQQWEEMLLYTGLVLCDPSSYSNYNNNNINNNANNTSFGTGNFSYGCYGSKNVYATEDDSNRNTRTRTDDDDDLQHDILRDLQRMEQEQERESSTIDNEEPSSSRLHHYEIHELRDLQHLELEHEISKIQIQQPKQQQQQQQQQQQHRHQEIPVSMIYSLLEDGGLVLSQKQQQQQQQQQARENHHHNIALEEGVEIWYDLQSKRFFSSSNSCNSNSNHNRNNNSIDSSTINDSDNYAANSKKRNKGGRRRSSGGGGGGLGQKSKIKYKNYDVNGYAGIKAKEYSPSHLTSSAGGPRHRQQSMTPTTIDGSSSSSASSCNSILDTDDDKGNNNNNSNNEHEHEHCNGIDSYRQQREHRCSRIVFISAGICIIISGLSMAIFGVSLLKESATKTLKVLEQVDGVTTKGMNIMDTFLDSSQSSMSSSSITNAATATAATAGDRTGSTNATTDLVDGEDSNNDSLYNVFERVMVLLIRTDKNDINDNNKSNNSNSVEQEEGGNCGAAILDNLDETIQQVNDYWNNNNNTTDNSTSPTITMSIWKNYVSKLDMIKQDVNYISDSVNYLYGLIVTHHEWIYQIIRLYNILLALFCAFILLLGTSNNNNNNNNSMSTATATARPRNHVSDSTTKKRKQNRHRYRSFYCWIIPFFIMFVIMSFITSIVFLVGSTTLADICMDNPDEKIIQFLQSSKQQQRDKFSSLNYDMAIYYVNQCPIEEIPIELTSTIKLGWDITGELWDASHLMVESRQIIEDVCSTSFDTIISEAVELSASSAATDALKEGEIVQDVACNFSVMLQDLVDLFQCDNWYHLYEAAVYDALCHGWGSGFFWVSITQLIIVIMSLIMLTFRIGYNNFDYNYNISNDNNNTKMSCEDEDREGGDHHDNTMIIIEDEDEDHGVNVDDEVGGVKNKPIHRQSLRIDKGGRSTNPHPHHKDGAYYHHTAATGEVRKGKLVRSVSDNVIVTASPFDDNHDYDDNDVNVNNVNDTSHMKMPQPPKQPKMGWLRQQQQQRHQILQQPDLHQFRSSSKVFHQSIGKNDNNDVDDDGNNGGSFLNYHDCDWDDDNGENMSAIEAPDSPSSRMRTIRTPPYFDIVERNQQQQAADNNGYKNDYYEPPNVEVCLKKTRINGNNDYGNGDEQSINTIDGVLMSPIVNRTITTTETDYENAYNDYDNNDRMMMKNLTTSTYGEDFATSSQVVETIDEKQRQRQRQRRLLKRPTQSSFSKAKATTTVTDNSRTANSITEEAARVRKRIEEIKDRRARLMKRQLGKSLE